MGRSAASAGRQRVQQAFEGLYTFVPKLLGVREEMVHGWVSWNRRKCGNPRCRCAKGELHEPLHFGTRKESRSVHRGIDPEKLEGLQAATGRWREYREARAELVKAFDSADGGLREMDALEESLSVPWTDWIGGGEAEGKEGER